MWRKILPFVWMIFVYTGTAMMVGRDPAPSGSSQRAVFEARHAITHLAIFAFQIWLVALALRLPSENPVGRQVATLIGLGFALGLGQETLQTILRQQLYLVDSVWDLAVDCAGAGLGWWIAYHLVPLNSQRSGIFAVLSEPD